MKWCNSCLNKGTELCNTCLGATNADGEQVVTHYKFNEDDYLEPIQFEDVVNKPTHYHQNGIDVIGFSELQFTKEELKGFYRINVLKYVTRYDRKNGVQDLEKAEFYLKKLMGVEKNG